MLRDALSGYGPPNPVLLLSSIYAVGRFPLCLILGHHVDSTCLKVNKLPVSSQLSPQYIEVPPNIEAINIP